jgi:tetratricopeptide (TPR) repeat protein
VLAVLIALPAASNADERMRGPKVAGVPIADWLEIEGPHFRLYGRSDKRSVVGLAKRVVSFIEVARAITTIERFAPRIPIRIIVFDDQAYAELWGHGTGGYMHPGPERFSLLVRGDNVQFLLHEYTHYLIHNQGLAYPRWFDEGFAELLATARFREDLAFIGAPPPNRIQTLRSGAKLLPLRLVLGARAYPESIAMFYAQSWLLTHYLHTSHAFGEPKLLDSMQDYLELLHRGIPWAIAFERAFDPTVEELAERLAQHRRRVAARDTTVPVLSLQLGLPDTSQLTLRRVAPARMAEILGDAHLALWGPSRKSESFYRESLGFGGGRPTAQAGLATVLAGQGRTGRARELVADALAAAPDSLSIQLAFGRITASAAKQPPDAAALQEARGVFRSIIERNPSHPAAYIALAESHLDAAGEVDEGIAALEHLAAQTPALVPGLLLAKLYRAAGRRADARRQLRMVVRWAGGKQADEARELLNELARDEIDEFDDDLETAEDPFTEPAGD